MEEKIVLVGVLKNQKDLDILLRDNWYRIPLVHAPKRKFDYIAFYQPLQFGKRGKSIHYYAKVLSLIRKKRFELLPEEKDHPKSRDVYLKINLGKIIPLSRPIKNIIPRRINFGFTSFDRLMTAKDILELYSIAPTEQIIENKLNKEGIKSKAQFYVLVSKRKRYRLDFAIFCKDGKIAVECDNKKAHNIKSQRKKDQTKDKILKALGWTVMRFSEDEILFENKNCVEKIKKLVLRMGRQ